MRTSPRFYAFLAGALLAVGACDQQAISTPIAPATTPTTADPGRINIAQLSPGGNSLKCIEEGWWCTLLLVVDVQLDQDVAEPWVTASFYNGSQRCGGTLSVRDSESIDPLRASTVTRFTTGPMNLSRDHTGIFCTATTKMVVQLWSERGRSPAPLLTREFAEYRTIFYVPEWDD